MVVIVHTSIHTNFHSIIIIFFFFFGKNIRDLDWSFISFWGTVTPVDFSSAISSCQILFLYINYKNIYLFLAVLSLPCHAGHFLVAVHGLLIAVASPVAEYGLQ